MLYWILEPEPKKLASIIPDPLLNLRGNSTAADQPVAAAALGGICNEDIRVPDKMVGLSKSKLLLSITL